MQELKAITFKMMKHIFSYLQSNVEKFLVFALCKICLSVKRNLSYTFVFRLKESCGVYEQCSLNDYLSIGSINSLCVH